MPRVRIVCQDGQQESVHRAAVAKAGFEVDQADVPGSKIVTHVRLTQPDAVVIDLDRLPSHGRAIATLLRTTKSTRMIPLIFAGGEREKTARIQSEFPDAVFGSWARVPALIREALRGKGNAPPVVPPKYMDQFRGAPLGKKLGLVEGATAVIGAPESFELRIGIPVDPRVTKKTRLAIWFIRSRAELEREFEFIALHPPLWIAFPKQTSGLRVDFTQHDVRRLAGEAGLVDNKVCAIDEDWSAIRFARRK
ncbi:MAG TPA: hypothetical protein VGL53_06540 [Bryobacteraceae bacterium]|jgi:hypothetical protein